MVARFYQSHRQAGGDPEILSKAFVAVLIMAREVPPTLVRHANVPLIHWLSHV